MQSIADLLKATFEVGRDSYGFGRLVPMLLASVLDPVGMEYKAFCCNFGDNEQSGIYIPSHEKHDTENIEDVIKAWALGCHVRN
jgi:hypothetical protein